MARIKLILPEKFNFSTQLDIRITDINYGGHLGNDSVLGMIHEARMRLLADKGFSESDIDGIGIIMLDSVINYSSEGFYGDKLRIDVTVDEITNSGCDIFYRFVNIANEKIIVRAKTNIAFYNYISKKVCRTPEMFLKAFK
ncbi:MAG: thioesterase family protein [Bacteroidales bacterium]|nr:thioesterase family protein [Bacteroidales bacterium]